MIAVIDMGSQYSWLICKRLRDEGIYTKLFPPQVSISELKQKNAQGIILSGGPASIYTEGAPTVKDKVLHSGIPILAICYGFQLLSPLEGGTVGPAEKREYGPTLMKFGSHNQLFSEVGFPPEPRHIHVIMSHGDQQIQAMVGSPIPSRSCRNAERYTDTH